MLTAWEYFWVGLFFVSDLILLKSYLHYKLGENQKKYNKKAFLLHVLGSLVILLLGPIVFLLNFYSSQSLSIFLTRIVGAACVFFAGPFAFSMARRTSGLKGFNLVGYCAYALYWMYSGGLALVSGQVLHAYDCYILSHAYFTCRLFVWAFEHHWPKSYKYQFSPDWNYSIATSIAACIPLAIVWQWRGVLLFTLGTCLGVILEWLNISPQWHVHFANGEPKGRLLRNRKSECE